ncbi:hypothetical protein BGZ68_009153 [Mortierella alpina]|nr:hypothetical protein BGZ68_009153 [Mortierella alpina]
MTRIIGAILLLKKLQGALHETYGGTYLFKARPSFFLRAFYQLMSKTQFMPFALVVIGMCSRLSLISGAWTNELLDCYRLLETWIKTFPKEEDLAIEVDYESCLPESVDSILPFTGPETPNATAQSTLQHLSTEAGDLGEVIARIETPVEAESVSSSYSPPFSNTALQQPQQARSERSSDKTTSILLNKPKKQNASPVLDNAVVGNKKSKVEPVIAVPSDSKTSPSLATKGLETGLKKKIKSKHKAGSATNFDDIFGSEQKAFDPDMSRSASTRPEITQARQKKAKGFDPRLGNDNEMDAIFGPVKKSKKPATSEIDNIFGPSKKKKKKIQ